MACVPVRADSEDGVGATAVLAEGLWAGFAGRPGRVRGGLAG